MTAASNPAAELTEAEVTLILDVYRAAGPMEVSPQAICLAVERILVARLAAGGAATDEGLREALRLLDGWDPDADSAGVMLIRLRGVIARALGAAPAPTEDATRMGGMLGTMTDPYRGRAADTAAEEPRTEAQIAVKALHAAEDDMDLSEFYQPSISGGISFECAKAESAAIQWLRDRADRLSRADEEAGS